jgi:hypothetical protein
MKKIVAFAALIVMSTPAYSKPHPHIYQQVRTQVQQAPQQQVRALQRVHIKRVLIRRQPIQNNTSRIVNHYPEIIMLPHPEGCPATAFCGCGAAKDLGIEDKAKALWAAVNWFKFPRAQPAPNMAAVAQHHVFVLKKDMGGGQWLVADYNSGGHLSRLHVRGLGGFTIVNPLPRLKSFWASFIG